MSGFPDYSSFFGTMRSELWDALASLEKKTPLHGFFARNSLYDDPSSEVAVVKSWLMVGMLDRTISGSQYSHLLGMVGTR